MQKQDLMILGAAAGAVWLITRKGGSLFKPTTATVPVNASYLPDATGVATVGNTDWVIPGSQQANMLAAQWPF